MKVTDISLDGFFGVICFLTDCWREIALEIESDDGSLVSLPSTDELDVPPGRQRSVVEVLVVADVLSGKLTKSSDYTRTPCSDV